MTESARIAATCPVADTCLSERCGNPAFCICSGYEASVEEHFRTEDVPEVAEKDSGT